MKEDPVVVWGPFLKFNNFSYYENKILKKI